MALGRDMKFTDSAGKVWNFSRFNIAKLKDFGAWVKEQVGDPFALAEKLLTKAEGYGTGPLQDAIIRQYEMEMERAKMLDAQLRGFSLNCPLAQQYMTTADGMGKMALIMLSGSHPNISEQEAVAVVLEMGAEDFAKILNASQGVDALPKSGKSPFDGSSTGPKP